MYVNVYKNICIGIVRIIYVYLIINKILLGILDRSWVLWCMAYICSFKLKMLKVEDYRLEDIFVYIVKFWL